MKNKYIIFLICGIFVFIIAAMNVKLICNDYDVDCENVIEFSFDKKYVTRKEFFELVLTSMGANDNTITRYSEDLPYVPPVTDYSADDMYEWGIITLANNCGILERRYKFNTELHSFDLAFDGDKYITLREAVVVLQSVLENTDNKKIVLYNKEFRELFNNSRKSGILNDKDLISIITIDRPLSQKECKILLSRFVKLSMYKYISYYEVYNDNSGTKYYDYLKNIR